MEYVYTSDIDEMSMEEEENCRGTKTRSHYNSCSNKNNKDNIDSKFKSKNLNAERRRRAKLNDNLLQLRTSVPIITNMNKATIIKDAITYIEELQKNVSDLSNDLLELGNTHQEEEIKPIRDEINTNPAQEMKNWGIQPEVKVFPMDDNKVWIKVVYQTKLGGLTKLVETITGHLEYEFNDVNLTTSKGAAVLTCCLEGTCDESLDVEETKELLLNVIST